MSAQITVTSDKADDLLFGSMTTDERLGRMFSYWVQFESRDAEIDLTGLLGSSMTVTIDTQDGYQRHFNGIVCEAAQTGVETVDGLIYAQYSVSLVPKPWLLASMVDCRIFTDMAVPDIVKAVLNEAGYSDVKLSLSASYAKREYCVQYREDGLNFISRLMEQEGIYYYFTHDTHTHTMVLADGVGSHAVTKEFAQVAYAAGTDSVLRRQATVSAWSCARSVDVTKCQLTDYNPLTPKASLLATGSASGHGSSDSVTVFDYPGTHGVADLGQHYAQVRAEALSAARSHYSGKTGSCGVEIGGLFTLSAYPRSALNQEYLVTAAAMQLHGASRASGGGSDEPSFSCSFEAIESRQPYRSLPTAAKPVVAGMQTAVVCGSDTDEDIAVDKYGRIQVTFHWNKPDKANAKSSCPVRVASPWAGKNWGAVSIPRVGQEVVVSFLEGDPDRPLIIGSVYNADQMPPYELPTNQTQSGVKSRSSKGATAENFNEIRFEDKKGSEEIYIHAEKDMQIVVENNQTIKVGADKKDPGDRSTTIQNDDTLSVGGNLDTTVTGKETRTVEKDRVTTLKANDQLDITNKYTLKAGDQITLEVGQAKIVMKSDGTIEISGMQLKLKGNTKVEIDGTQTAISGQQLDVKGTKTAVQGSGMLDLASSGIASLKGSVTKIG
jgi:type VI secretion system secreted protein VgrG